MNKKIKSIFITAPGRSGTSMVSGILNIHGIFFGECGSGSDINPKGFYENLWLKRQLKEKALISNYEEILKEQGKKDNQLWAFELRPVWIQKVMVEIKPDIIVYCYRSTESILKSHSNLNWNHDINGDIQKISFLRKTTELPFFTINVREIIKGNYFEIQNLFEFIGIEFKKELVKEFVDPNLWHHGG